MGAFPDSDFVLGLFNRQFYLEYHRNFTHSLLLAPFYALFFAWGFCEAVKAASLLEFLRNLPFCFDQPCCPRPSYLLRDDDFFTLLRRPLCVGSRLHRRSDLLRNHCSPLDRRSVLEEEGPLDLSGGAGRSFTLHPFLLGSAPPGPESRNRLRQNGSMEEFPGRGFPAATALAFSLGQLHQDSRRVYQGFIGSLEGKRGLSPLPERPTSKD